MTPDFEVPASLRGRHPGFAHDLDAAKTEDTITMVISVLTPDLLSDRYREELTTSCHPATGHCAVAAEAVYFLLGGRFAGLVPMVAREEDGSTHWWLVHRPSGTIIDPTRAQYDDVGDVPPYERGNPGRACGFQGMRRDPENKFGFGLMPGARAAELLRRVERNDRERSLMHRSDPTPVI